MSPAIDLDVVKASALDQIDRVFASREPRLSDVYAAKADLAGSHGGVAHPMIVTEAASRGTTPAALCRQIVARHGEACDALLEHEARRQEVKASVRAATSQHAILVILADQGAARL